LLCYAFLVPFPSIWHSRDLWKSTLYSRQRHIRARKPENAAMERQTWDQTEIGTQKHTELTLWNESVQSLRPLYLTGLSDHRYWKLCFCIQRGKEKRVGKAWAGRRPSFQKERGWPDAYLPTAIALLCFSRPRNLAILPPPFPRIRLDRPRNSSLCRREATWRAAIGLGLATWRAAIGSRLATWPALELPCGEPPPAHRPFDELLELNVV
jgi:hypothetical protein